ncbi:hypothetical protein [Peribacillus simplex]
MEILYKDNHARSEVHVAGLHKDAMIEIEVYFKQSERQIDIFFI